MALFGVVFPGTTTPVTLENVATFLGAMGPEDVTPDLLTVLFGAVHDRENVEH